ncbi:MULTISPECIES: hypothetical protein [unclassified Exiguobacterium]|uniref:hypothetical protein n=1 Tax=unclassified Exiguobacterium TaxID=2644629 RepID=UPI001BE6A9D1|nr:MULTISPECIES: hypothetical protein [unclassified Exiguobacterium]
MSIDVGMVDRVLEHLAKDNHRRFNAYQINSASHQSDVEKVNEYLLFRSKGSFAILEAKIETLCEENNHPDEHFDIDEKIPEYEIECRICGNEYVPDLENSHLVFYFKDSYLESVKKKLTIQNSLVAI